MIAAGTRRLTDLVDELQRKARRFVLQGEGRGQGGDLVLIAALAARPARSLGLDPAEVHVVETAGRLRDVGKIVTLAAVLRKSGTLTEAEWVLIRQHPVVGARVVGQIPSLPALVPLIRAHHERWDGKGYPDGLAGSAIPLGARILAVAEAYAAMTTDRPHRPAWAPERALGELQHCVGSQFDACVVAALGRILAEGVAREPAA